MKKISRNKQKDTQPLAGLLGMKQILLVPLSIFGFIVSFANITIQSVL
ncbi:hypothetical protein MNBD_GAMMA03-1546 [hydrothermal vent metagenome]|uniref:Uncharacterized protein n=1 Tax=hydrothermal vent metagenome TaxID=652676 RepID=A0A3B0VRY2_9ZZZZ